LFVGLTDCGVRSDRERIAQGQNGRQSQGGGRHKTCVLVWSDEVDRMEALSAQGVTENGG